MLLGLVVALLAAVTTLAMPQILAAFVSNVLGEDASVTTVLVAGSALLGIGILDAVFIWLRRVFTVDPAMGVEYQMRRGFFSKVQRLQMSFHDAWESGQLLSRSMSDHTSIRRWLAFGSIMLVNDVFMLVVGIVLMSFASGWLALIYLAGALPLVIILANFGTRFQKISRLSQDQAGDLATNVEQSVHGIRVLKAFGRAEDALDDYSGYAGRVRATEIRRGRLVASFDSVIALLPEIALGVALLVGLFQVADGTTTVAALSAFFATAMLITMPVAMLGMQISDLISTITSLQRINEVHDEPATITTPAHATEPELVRGEVVFDDVTFRYPDAAEEDLLLQDANLRVRPGETLALVGITGSGKSTLLQLVPRLYDVTEGSIRIDGVDVRDYALDRLRQLTSVAFEDATLLSGSVRENVLLGAAAGMSEEELDELARLALETADALFAYELPDGIETRIGEQGMSLSGGQRQRVALARAIAAKPKVLLLDDPLSALDTSTEERVTARLREVLAGTTTIVVAHRTSTVALADRVALLDGGRVVAVGTHTELLLNDPRYGFVMANLSSSSFNLTGALDLEQLREEER
ncbi:ABC transporter ATP-binding protein [Gulosibacter sediminis]|uniref:ABC transporter ATP-binding protein n=1 Tax=Gulosibacter sediminis TaxID=1729695 RepID=UPI0024AD392D|nr:ABC transporter ATP-binding protein [Gulosibacter sediminis]